MTNYRMYFLLQELRKQSKCLDKQVACILTDIDDNIISVGVNKVIYCNDCTSTGSKEGCSVIHAEEVAAQNVSDLKVNSIKRAYVSLFPCENCQRILNSYVDEIIVFGEQHKQRVIPASKIKLVPNLIRKLHEMNGEQKQLSVIISELSELIKAITDYFYRRHERDIEVKDLLDEVIDVRLMSSVLMDLLEVNHSVDVIPMINDLESDKLGKVKKALLDGRIKRGSPYSK